MRHYIYILQTYNGKEGWITRPSGLFITDKFLEAYCFEDLKSAMLTSQLLNIKGIPHNVFKL